MSQVQQQQKQQHKFQPCRNGCGQLITFDKAFRGKNNGWVPLDEITDSLGQKKLQAHQCPAKNKEQPPEQSQPDQQQQKKQQLDVSKEIAAVKAELLLLVRRLDHMEKELQAKNGGLPRK